jgi:hypothetical protein
MSVVDLIGKKQYASVRNILQYKFAEEWASEGFIFRTAPTETFYLAQACEMIGDYDYARILLETLNELDWKSKIVSTEIEHLSIREKSNRFVDVKCNDQKVRDTLLRLVKVFHNLKRNITAFVGDSESEYKRVWNDYFGTPFDGNCGWGTFYAVGVYKKPGENVLFFTQQSTRCSEVEFLGLCAHEIAHLEQYDVGIRDNLTKISHMEKENSFFNERFTDLYVISRGFGYELACDRKSAGENRNRLLMSYKQIIECIEDSNLVN